MYVNSDNACIHILYLLHQDNLVVLSGCIVKGVHTIHSMVLVVGCENAERLALVCP